MIKDKTDWAILSILQQKARISFASIGREVKLSASAVAERVQRMEAEGIIEKYKSVINPKKVGYGLSAYITMSFLGNGYNGFIRSLKEFPEITECSRVTGNSCLIMKVVLKDQLHLEGLIDRLIPFGSPSTSLILSDLLSEGSIKQL